MITLNNEVRAALTSGHLAHLVTLNADGSPQVAIVWVGLDGDEIVSAHLSGAQRKLSNVRHDSRVCCHSRQVVATSSVWTTTWWSTDEHTSSQAALPNCYSGWQTSISSRT